MNIADALRAIEDPFDDGIDEEALLAAEMRGREIRDAEVSRQAQASSGVEAPERVATGIQAAAGLSGSGMGTATEPPSEHPFPSAMGAAPAQADELVADTASAQSSAPAGGAPEGQPPAPAQAPTPAHMAAPAGVAAPAPPPVALPQGLAGTPIGKSLATAGFAYETPAEQSIRNLFRGAMAVDGVITCGDAPVDPAVPEQPENILRALGFPDRPRTWPRVMAWPPQIVLDRFTDPRVNAEQRAEMIRRLLELDRAMLVRARQIHEWMEASNPGAEQDRTSRRFVRQVGNDPHYGLNWATLINPAIPDRAILATVISWGYSLAHTSDGGAVRASQDAITFPAAGHGMLGYTQQSVTLGIQEARNRGWKKLNLSGSYEFGMLAIDAAKKAGIEATVTYRGRGLKSWRTYTVKVMPDVPAPQIEDPGGSGPDVSHAATAGATAPVEPGAALPAAAPQPEAAGSAAPSGGSGGGSGAPGAAPAKGREDQVGSSVIPEVEMDPPFASARRKRADGDPDAESGPSIP